MNPDELLKTQRHLVQMIKDRPLIWQYRQPGVVRRKADLNNAYQEISNALGCWDLRQVKKEWCCIRQKYRMIRKKMQAGDQHQTYFALFGEVHSFLGTDDEDEFHSPVPTARAHGHRRRSDSERESEEESNDERDTKPGINHKQAMNMSESFEFNTAASSTVKSQKRRGYDDEDKGSDSPGKPAPNGTTQGATPTTKRSRQTHHVQVAGADEARSPYGGTTHHWDIQFGNDETDLGRSQQGQWPTSRRASAGPRSSMAQSPSSLQPGLRGPGDSESFAASSTVNHSPSMSQHFGFQEDARLGGVERSSSGHSQGVASTRLSGVDDAFLNFVGDTLAQMTEERRKIVKIGICKILM